MIHTFGNASLRQLPGVGEVMIAARVPGPGMPCFKRALGDAETHCSKGSLMKKRLMGLVLGAAIVASGCSLTQTSESTSPAGGVAPPPAPMDNYYDFNDVAVPQEMNLQLSDSFILETPTARTGVMTFTGKVDAASLRNYYANVMVKDGWTMKSAIKSNKSILLFEKPGKYAVIIITDGTLRTRLEIWVTPEAGSIGEAGFTSTGQGSSLAY